MRITVIIRKKQVLSRLLEGWEFTDYTRSNRGTNAGLTVRVVEALF